MPKQLFNTIQRRLIVMTGESNSGGRGANTDATSQELAPRNNLYIWHNTSLAFQKLDIGTNNLIDHAGLTSFESSEHSWELQLANIYDSLGVQYLVKRGQGGSVISEWGTGGTYYGKLKTSVNLARGAVSFNKIVFYITLGINDRIAGTSTATFKTGVQTWIAALKADWPGCKIIFLKGMTDNGNDLYNTKLQEIADADAEVDLVNCSTSVQGDGNHWTYAGQKTNATNFYNAMVANNW